MRPRELTVRGFRSYRSAGTFDWRDRRLVGIVGPIGSGKSSILDAISFALYAKTPNIERDTKTLIHQLCDECHVELVFEVDGQTWRVQRALRRRGQAGHRLELLASDDGDAEVLDRANGERDVNTRVEQLLGMDFKAFCRSVLLAQNRFHEFLRATAGDRDRVLKGVFGYDRLDQAHRAAKLRFDAVGLEVEALKVGRARIVEARTELEGARRDAAAAKDWLERLKAAAPEVERLRKAIQTAGNELEAAQARTTEILGVSNVLPTPDDVESEAAAAATAEAVVAEAQAALGTAVAERADAEAALAEVTARVGDRGSIRTFRELVHTHHAQAADVARLQAEEAAAAASVERAEAQAEQRRTESEEAGELVREAATALAVAEADLGAANERVLLAQHADMARTLRGDLRPGEPCPVCAQPVHTLPRAIAAPKVTAAVRALERATAAAESLRERQRQAETTLTRAEVSATAAAAAIGPAKEAADSAAGRTRTASDALEATQSELVTWLGEDGDLESLFADREAELNEAEHELDLAKDAVDRRTHMLEEARDRAAGVHERLVTLANRLAGCWGRLGRDRVVVADPDTVRAARTELAEAVVAAHDEAAAQADAARDRAATAAERLASMQVELGLAADADFNDARAEAGYRHGSAAARVTELETTIKQGDDLEARFLEAESRRDIADRLTRDLKPSRFLAFLLEEERSELAQLGSDHLDQLTDGGYRFSADDRFDIIDLNAAGQVRRSDSLSGGETFLASLALALALAQMVARGGGRLDAFFLDEGFGSLDPDHLDRAMEGIGRLVAGDERRLVVLVSHVAEMREAIEDLVVLDKDALTGDTIVRSGASPA